MNCLCGVNAPTKYGRLCTDVYKGAHRQRPQFGIPVRRLAVGMRAHGALPADSFGDFKEAVEERLQRVHVPGWRHDDAAPDAEFGTAG